MIRNLDYIRSKDPKLYEAISDLDRHAGNLEQQVNGNRTGQPLPPPSIDGLTVTGQNGHFHAQISHKSQIYRGIQYYLEYADNSGFQNPRPIHLGDSREHTHFLGNGTYYWRAFASYSSSGPGSPAYHGGSATPQPVSGGGAVGGPAFLPPQGSGTGAPGQGLSGPGTIPFRSQDGAPPVRGKSIGGGASGGGGSPGGSLVPSPATGLPAGASSLSPGGGGGGVVASAVIFDVYVNWTAANYPPAQFPLNTQIVITDRNYIRYSVQAVAGVNKWVYEFGTYSVVQSAIAGLKGFNAAVLGTNDTGLKIEVTDYAHVLKWGGAAWGWGAGELGSGYFSDFAVAPTGSGWHACDGSSGIKYLKADGTTATVDLPDSNGSPCFRENSGAYSAVISAATAPTVNVPTFTGNPSASIDVPSTGAPTVAVVPGPFTPSGTIGAQTVSLPGVPVAYYQAVTYFRQ